MNNIDTIDTIDIIDYKLDKYLSKMNSIHLHDNMTEYELNKFDYYFRNYRII